MRMGLRTATANASTIAPATTAYGTCRSCGTVHAPNAVVAKNGEKARPAPRMPANMPAMTATPSPRPLAAATHDVPGQRPAIRKPAPKIAPPASLRQEERLRDGEVLQVDDA